MNEDAKIYNKFAFELLNIITPIYWCEMWEFINEHNIEHKYLTGFLQNLQKIVLSIGREHIAIENYGFERTEELTDNFRVDVEINDYSKMMLKNL